MAKRQRPGSAASSSGDEAPDTDAGTFKYVQFDERSPRKPLIRCALAPHSTSAPFYSLEEYDVHYAQVHSNRCRECHKNLPSSHFLSLHISENHDPINEARRARGEKTVRQMGRVYCCEPCLMSRSTLALWKVVTRCAQILGNVACTWWTSISSPRITTSLL